VQKIDVLCIARAIEEQQDNAPEPLKIPREIPGEGSAAGALEIPGQGPETPQPLGFP